MTNSALTQRLAGALLAAGLGVATLSACGNGVESSGSTPTRTVTASDTPSAAATTASATPTASTTGTSGSTSDSSGSGSSGPGICAARDLKVSEVSPAGGGTAGSTYTELRFANTSSRTCVLDGHPGVSFVGEGSGTQLGRGATFIGATKRVSLAPGDQTGVQLRIADPGAYGDDCAPVAADGFRVYPPDSRASVFVKDSAYRACSKALPGGRSQLSVTAVGTE